MSIFQHDGLTLIKGKDNILYLIREKNTDECRLMESNCQTKDKEFEVLIDHQHRIAAEQLNRTSKCGGWRGEKDRQRRPISILDVPILVLCLNSETMF